MRKIKRVSVSLFVLCSTFFANCKPFKIALSNELSDAPGLAVKGRNGIMINQKLSFGNYQTAKINRSWTEGSGMNMGPMEVLWVNYSQKRQSLHFTMNDNTSNKAEVFCLSKVRSEDYTIGSNPNSIINIMGDVLGIGGKSESNYAVSIFLNKDGNPWQLVLDNQSAQRNSKTYTGYLAQNKNNYYTIHPVTALERDGKKGNILAGSVGFEIRTKDGKAVAAVSMMDRGIVYLAETTAQEKFLLANACAALLLQENIG